MPIASNHRDRRIGSVTEDRERFFEWKRIERENELGQVSLLVIVYESYPSGTRGIRDGQPRRVGGGGSPPSGYMHSRGRMLLSRRFKGATLPAIHC